MHKEFQVGDAVEFTEDYEKWAFKGATGVIDFVWPPCGDFPVAYDVRLDSTDKTVYTDPSLLKHVEAFEIPADFRFFRRTDGAISEVPYPTFEAALEGWRGFAQNGDQTEIIELISHGTYKATLKVEVVEPITEEA